MTPIILHRVVPLRNLSRFYRLDVQQAGRVRIDAYPNRTQAIAWAQRQQKTKQGRGYRPISR